MKKTLRVLALIMTLLMFLPVIVACKKDSGNEGGNEGGNGNVVSTDPDDPYASRLPAYDWDEDIFYILSRDGESTDPAASFEVWRESLTGDVVGDAVWNRNETLRQKYNFIVDENRVDNTYTEAQTLYEAQDDVYDLVMYQPTKVFSHASAGFLLDLNTIPYIDFEHPTWNKEINTQLTIAGKLYSTSSQFLLLDKKRTYCMFYNRELAREYDLGSLEAYVDANAWTLDVFEVTCKALSFDIDGGGGGHIGDNFGLATEGPASFAALLTGAGFTLGTNDGETITLTGATKAMDDIVTAVGKTWNDKTVTTIPEDHVPFDYYTSVKIFTAERALFMLSFPSEFDVKDGLNANCTFEFGVMPFPKYSSTQERYYNMNNYHNSALFSIPYTVADPAQVGFYLQAISEESCKTTYTAYIDSKCKVQDSYDELTARMLDLCFQSATYDIVACLDPGGIFKIITEQVPNFRTNVFVRLYQGKGDAPQTALDEYIATISTN